MKAHKCPIDSYRLERDQQYMAVVHNMTNQPIPCMTQMVMDQGLDYLKVVIYAHKNPLRINQKEDAPEAVRYTFEGNLDKLILTMFEEYL